MVSLTDNDHDMVIFLMFFVGEYFQRRYGNRRPIYNVLDRGTGPLDSTLLQFYYWKFSHDLHECMITRSYS